MEGNTSFVADRDDTKNTLSVIDLHCFLNSIVSDLTFLVCRHRQDKFKFSLMHAAVYLAYYKIMELNTEEKQTHRQYNRMACRLEPKLTCQRWTIYESLQSRMLRTMWWWTWRSLPNWINWFSAADYLLGVSMGNYWNLVPTGKMLFQLAARVLNCVVVRRSFPI